MANLVSFITELAAVTGTKSDSLTAFAEANKAIEIPDEIMNGIRGGIFTLESAKNNPQIKAHYTATSRAGIDDEIYNTMKEYGLDDQAIAEVKKEDVSTPNKVRVMALRIKELQEKKINAKGGDAKVLQEKIDALSEQLAAANADALKQKETLEAKVLEAKNQYSSKLRDYQVDKHFQGYTYANEKIPLEVHIMTAKGLFDKKAKEIGLKTVFDEETGQVKLLTTTDTIYYKDNKPVDFKGFTDSLLAENHLLKVTDKPAENSGGGGNQIHLPPANGQGKINNSKYLDAVKVASEAISQTN